VSGTFLLTAVASSVFLSGAPAAAAGRQQLRGHVPLTMTNSRLVGRMPRQSRLNLAIGLPLRNQEALETLLVQLYDPASPNYNRYLTPETFAEQFGPTEEDYQAVIQFAEAHGLVVTGTHPNRTILDVSGAVAEIEKAFHVNIQTRWHPVRGNFFAPDTEPSLDLDVPILGIGGLDNFILPRPMGLKTAPLTQNSPLVSTGSGPGGLFIGKDFRAAYAPGVTLTGAGQTVGLFELGGFYASDVPANFKQAGLPVVPVKTVLVNGFSGVPNGSNTEVILDIMMAAYMAPGLSNVIVYEGSSWNDVLNRMATDNLAHQLSSSWCFSPINATTEQIFKQYIAQGQSLFQASGDSGAYRGWIFTPSDNPNLTVVGGTSLATSGYGGPWQSEATWPGSGGGSSTAYPMPSYQQGVNMAANGGSATMRNIPDVALTADVQMFLIQSNGQAISVGGTSAAAPLWAGFTALVNQQAAANGKPAIGFLNPLIYAIGKGTNYTADFHDIRTGSNGYTAVSGYDLSTGWGTPAGQHLIDDLTGIAGQPNFTLSAAPAVLSLKQGGTGSSTIAVGAQNGFKSSVNLSVTGLPTGVTASFSAPSTTGTSTLTFTSSALAPAGVSTVTVSGVSGTLKAAATVALTVTVPNFVLSLSTGSLGLVPGSSGSSAVTLNAQNGFGGSVSLSASGLPGGVTAAFAPASATSGSIVTFTAGSSAPAGAGTVTITGTSGALSRTATVALTVVVPTPNTTLVNLTSVYNVGAIVSDGFIFASGVDGKGAAYSSNLLGPAQTLTGTTLYFGPANAPDALTSKTVPLPAGTYSTLKFAAAAMNGNLPSQTFTVTYSDGTATAFTQSISDWFTPQNYAGETKVATTAYRDNSNGTPDNRTFLLYGYSFALNSAKKVSSIALPNNQNLVVLAISLTQSVPLAVPAAVNLSTAFDTTGISTDGKAFTGGMDGVGFSYSANLLGAARTIGATPFNFGPADAPDAVSGNGKTIVLTAGKFSTLLMLGTAVNGSQPAQPFKVTYSDGTSATFTQTMSDWFKPQNYPGETQAVAMQRRNTSKGAPDNGPYYIYGYSFALNNAKTVSGITMPGNRNVRLLAVTLVP
jgi:hypothetical protein